ncbi:MAG UNVERIFIED_CONTAM: hypothetical protein LVR18_50790 [Planctomycetaceae bacterium]|jgi:hypothetical protein
MTAAASRVYKGGTIIVQVAGGVRVDVRDIVNNPESFQVTTEVEYLGQKRESGRTIWSLVVGRGSPLGRRCTELKRYSVSTHSRSSGADAVECVSPCAF